MKKFLCGIIAVLLLISSVPSFSFADDSENTSESYVYPDKYLTDSKVFASEGMFIRSGIFENNSYPDELVVDSRPRSSEHRMGFIKFDFTGNEELFEKSQAIILRLNTKTDCKEADNNNFAVYMLNDNMEDIDSSLTFASARDKGLVDFLDNLVYMSDGALQPDATYETVDLKKSIIKNFESNPDNKVVWFKIASTRGVGYSFNDVKAYERVRPALIMKYPKESLQEETLKVNPSNAAYVRNDSNTKDKVLGGSTLVVDSQKGIATRTNRRVSFVKFDFADYADDLDSIREITFNIAGKDASTTEDTNYVLYILPDEKENWSSETLTYTIANENMNIVSTDCGDVIYTSGNVENRNFNSSSNIKSEIIKHLKNNTNNTVVSFKIDTTKDKPYQIYGIGSGYDPYITVKKIFDTAAPESEESSDKYMDSCKIYANDGMFIRSGIFENNSYPDELVVDSRSGSSVNRVGFVKFDFTGNEDILDKFQTISLRLTTKGDCKEENNNNFAVYMLKDEMENIDTSLTYSEAAARGLTSYNENLVYTSDGALMPNTTYETGNLKNAILKNLYDNPDNKVVWFKIASTNGVGYSLNGLKTDENVKPALTAKYPALADPMTVSDEKLFGKWNKTDGVWKINPILRYDIFPGLSGVLSAVKDGNYENAKSELLAYYRLKDEDEKYTFEAGSSYNITAEAMNDKIWTYSDNDSLLGQAYIEDEWDWYSIDLTGGSNRRGTYYLVDSDMDGSYLEIASKENSNGLGAYFEVTVNGVKSVIPVNADTYISAGDNIDTNYGTEEILYCREAAGGPTLPIGTNTQRPYFKFDLGGISRTATATSVKLNFYGRAVGSERKKIYCFTTNNNKDFDENEFTWKEIYPQVFNFKETGFLWLPVSDHENIWNTEYEWLNYSTRYYQVMWLMQAYLLNKNEEYVYRSLEFAMSQLTQQPSGKYPRALDSGWRIQNIIRLMHTAIESEFMTPEIFTALLKYTYGHADILKNVNLGVTNQDSAVKVNVARICAYFPEITSDELWNKAKNNLYTFYAEKFLNSDGSYTESCTNYISGVVDEFTDAAEMIKARDGEDSELYKFFVDQLKKLVTYYMNLGYSNRKTVPYGDGGRGDLDGNIKTYNELLDDNDLRYFASKGEEGKEPDYTSALYPAKAVCMMRSGWHEDDLCAFLNNDNGGSHGHCDELGLDVLAFGKYLLVDAGVSSYSEGSEFAQTRHKTLYHNTIEIDDKDQNHAGSNIPEYMDFRSNASFDFLHAATDMAYDGFNMNRKVLMLKNKYIIVSDFINVTDSEPHTYRLLWHPDRNNSLALDPTTGMAYTSYDNQPNIKIVPSDSSAQPKLFNRLMNQPGYGEASSRSVQYNKENAVGDQYFDTVLYPENTGSDDTVTVSRITLDSNDPTAETALEVKINDNTGYYYSSNAENTSAAKFGKYIYDGRMAYVETDEDGELSYIAMTDGSELKDAMNNYIVKSSVKLSDFSAAAENSVLKLYTSDTINFSINIYLPGEFTTVYLNDEEVNFEYINGVITVSAGAKKGDAE